MPQTHAVFGELAHSMVLSLLTPPSHET